MLARFVAFDQHGHLEDFSQDVGNLDDFEAFPLENVKILHDGVGHPDKIVFDVILVLRMKHDDRELFEKSLESAVGDLVSDGVMWGSMVERGSYVMNL